MAALGPEIPVIQGESLEKRYGDTLALQPLDFTVEKGAVFGLLGANGGGKSTLLKVIARLEQPSSGSLQYWGEPSRLLGSGIQQKIGYMAQSFALYSTLSVLENIEFRAALYDLPTPKLAAERVIEKYGLVAHANQRAGTLSGGWARLLQLAASLVHAPPLALLDEPTAGLDAEARRTVWHHIRRLSAEGTTVIIATHDMLDAELCDSLLYLSEGHLLGQGTPTAVIRSAAVAKFNVPAGMEEVSQLLKGQSIPFVQELPGKPYNLLTGQESVPILANLGVQPVDTDVTLEDASILLKLRARGHTAAANTRGDLS